LPPTAGNVNKPLARPPATIPARRAKLATEMSEDVFGEPAKPALPRRRRCGRADAGRIPVWQPRTAIQNRPWICPNAKYVIDRLLDI
jgi:hypothetical protein